MSTVLSAVFGAACLLLLIAGALKVADPSRTVGALRSLGWSHGSLPVLVRVGALVETLLAAAGLAVGGPVVAGAVGVSYLAFAAFVALALRADAPIGSCGCLGAVDTPPSIGHVVLDLVFAGGALGALATGGADAVVDADLLTFLVAVAVAAGGYLVMARRPRSAPSG